MVHTRALRQGPLFPSSLRAAIADGTAIRSVPVVVTARARRQRRCPSRNRAPRMAVARRSDVTRGTPSTAEAAGHARADRGRCGSARARQWVSRGSASRPRVVRRLRWSADEIERSRPRQARSGRPGSRRLIAIGGRSAEVNPPPLPCRSGIPRSSGSAHLGARDSPQARPAGRRSSLRNPPSGSWVILPEAWASDADGTTAPQAGHRRAS